MFTAYPVLVVGLREAIEGVPQEVVESDRARRGASFPLNRLEALTVDEVQPEEGDLRRAVLDGLDRILPLGAVAGWMSGFSASEAEAFLFGHWRLGAFQGRVLLATVGALAPAPCLVAAAGAVLSAFVFSLPHLYPEVLVPVFILGIGFALIYEWTGTLWASFAVHAAHNTLHLVWLYLSLHHGAPALDFV